MKSKQEILRLSRQKIKRRLLLILLCIMVVSIAAAIILISFMSDEETAETEKNPPEILDSEALYGSYPIAYPTMQKTDIQSMTVINKNSYKDYYDDDRERSYALVRYDDPEDKRLNGKFVLLYQDKDGNSKFYYPPIADKDSAFDYESLYAIDLEDGYGTPKITYLCLAIQLPYFTDRIPLVEPGAGRDSQLKGFGLDDPQSEIIFTYQKTYEIIEISEIFTDSGSITTVGTKVGNNNRIKVKYKLSGDSDATKVYEAEFDLSSPSFDAKTVAAVRELPVGKFEKATDLKETFTRGIKIGDKNVTEYGYYFMVTEEMRGSVTVKDSDYRPYVYNSMAEYFNYAMLGFYSYVNTILVSEGLSQDSSYEPYLTTDYKQWENTLYKDEEGTAPEDSLKIEEGSTAIVYTDILTPVAVKLSELKDGFDGYEHEEEEMEIDLSKGDGYKKFANVLTGKRLQEVKDIFVTLSNDSRTIFLDDETKSVTYKYVITAIEAILTDGADLTEGAVGENNTVKLKYNLFVGDSTDPVCYIGVLDLSNDKLDADAVAKIREASIGTLEEPIELSVTYTKENSISRNIRYIVDEILEIYNENGKNVTTVTNKCQVYYRYYFIVDGKKTDYEVGVVDMSSESDDPSEILLRTTFLGKSLEKDEDVKKLGLELSRYTSYYEYMQEFITYNVTKATGFVASELISAFAYQNNSERDSFYGESIYENKLSDKYSIYAINSATCEKVVRMLGGIGETSNTSDGLVGYENVAVGITPALKERYGLYAHTIYFELPRGVIVIDSGDGDTVDDYSQYSKLGFTLYVSEEQYDETYGIRFRYVGSDLYDVIAKVDAEKLEFLDYGFVEFWARKSLMMFNINALAEMKIEFMMEDLKGSYKFIIPTESKDGTNFEVKVTEECIVNEDKKHTDKCGCLNTKLRELKGNKASATLTELYTKYFASEGEKYYDSLGNLLYGYMAYDTAGVGYFRDFSIGLASTSYGGYLTAEEQKEGMKAPLLLRLSVKLDMENSQNTTEDTHVYEFYRLDDRRVMVCQYQVNSKGVMTTEAVTDFYVTTIAFKRIVGNALSLLNAEAINLDVPYTDVSK